MISRALRGLRGRLLLSLVFTSAATLAVAAAITLGPLQSRLRDESATNLQTAVDDLRPEFTRVFERTAKVGGNSPRAWQARSGRRAVELIAPINELRDRTGGARVLVADTSWTSPGGETPGFLYDTDLDVDQADAFRLAYRSYIDGVSDVQFQGGDLLVSMPLFGDGAVTGVVIAERSVTEVTTSVRLVRNALFTAALIGLAVAIALGLALSSTLTRRLGRLQRAARRIAAEGPEAPAPTDRGNDEVGALARALTRMQEELRRQETARRSFVATASHELRTPLTMLQGTMELLDEDLREGADTADALEQVANARRELRRLSTLATELLDLSRLDAAVQLRSEPVELGEITRAVAAEFALRAADRDVEVVAVPPAEPCWAHADPAACARVVRILVDNALRYAPAGEPIVVTVARSGQRVLVEVTDRGPGVPEEEREHIFERFHRGKATSVESGFGLGLAIGRELTERMNGRLTLVESEERGARFRLNLPATIRSSPAPSPAPGSAAAA